MSRSTVTIRRRLLALGLAALMATSSTLAGEAAASGDPDAALVVFLVRHAEKVDSSRDPELSQVGLRRADALARTLADSGLERIHSTDFVRTRTTAGPTAAAVGVALEIYDHERLDQLVEAIRRTGGRQLVVGHSDTTPAVVELLGGDPGPPYDEGGEFDRLYVVTIGEDGGVSTVRLRYGE